jgi:hypothetical protein
MGRVGRRERPQGRLDDVLAEDNRGVQRVSDKIQRRAARGIDHLVQLQVVGHPRRCLGAGVQLSPVAMLELQSQPSFAAAIEQPMDHASHGGSMHVRVRKIYRIAGTSPNLILVFATFGRGVDCRDARRT